jgi:hypothetical protein
MENPEKLRVIEEKRPEEMSKKAKKKKMFFGL